MKLKGNMNMTDLYNVLGVSKDASKQDIKRAYQRKAKETHPDAGGTNEGFAAVSKAYKVLHDDDLRKEYDETGKVGQEYDERREILSLLTELFYHVISQGSDDTNYLKMMKNSLVDSRGKFEHSIKSAKSTIKRLEKISKKITKKRGGDNIFTSAIDSQIKNQKQVIDQNEKAKELNAKLLIELEEYDFIEEKDDRYSGRDAFNVPPFLWMDR